jgi:hypothetical protein
MTNPQALIFRLSDYIVPRDVVITPRNRQWLVEQQKLRMLSLVPIHAGVIRVSLTNLGKTEVQIKPGA